MMNAMFGISHEVVAYANAGCSPALMKMMNAVNYSALSGLMMMWLVTSQGYALC